MNVKNNRIISVIIALLIIISGTFPHFAEASADNVLYKEIQEEELRKGISYTLDRRLTVAGWLDTHVIKVDLTNPDLRLGVLESKNQYNMKEKTTDLIKSNGAVAGINGDFFDTTQNPTGSLGMVAKDGKLVSTYNNININENKWTTFFMDKEGNPFIDYCKVAMKFYNENGISIGISGINKITSFKYAVYLDRNSYTSTAEIDSRHKYLYKIVVENDEVTYISKQGEIVEVPENGYVIVMDEPTAVLKRAEFKIGQKVYFDFQTSVDMSKIQMALGGAGKIVDKGTVPINPGHVVSPNARNPRTALGISQDGKTLYLVAVDGRSHSVGATHGEMTSLLLEYGVYDAIHLDGGGSTTIAAKTIGKDEVALINKPSDGSERKVVNGLGVFLDAPVGELVGLKMTPNYNRVFQNMGVTLDIVGYDKNLSPVHISMDQIKWTVENLQGSFSNNIFYPQSAGTGTITAQVGNVKETVSLTCMGIPKALKAHPDSIRIKPGETVDLWVVGLNEEGYKAPIDMSKMIWHADPSLGTIVNNKFTASNTVTQGVIEGVLEDIKVVIPVAVGEKVTPIESFEEEQITEWTSYPEDVIGQIIEDTTIKYEGNQSLKMTYSFKEKPNVTQAAYINFKQSLFLNDNPKAIGMWVYGDNSKDWLRANIKDVNGQEYLIDFTRQIDWTGWKYVQGTIPGSVSYPISLDKIYTVTLNNQKERENSIYIDHISTIASPEINKESISQSTKLTDKHEQFLADMTSENSLDITFFGTIKNDYLEEEIQEEIISKMNYNASFSVYVGTDIYSSKINVPYMKFRNQYEVNDIKDIRIIQLSVLNGGIKAANPEQWKWLQNDLNTTMDNIIIVMDKSPLSPDCFTDSMESELFHKLLRRLKEEQNKNIFVISSEQNNNQVQIKEGIRYMNISDSELSILRFRVNDSKISYEFQPIYN